jgi:hypothetical protein
VLCSSPSSSSSRSRRRCNCRVPPPSPSSTPGHLLLPQFRQPSSTSSTSSSTPR